VHLQEECTFSLHRNYVNVFIQNRSIVKNKVFCKILKLKINRMIL